MKKLLLSVALLTSFAAADSGVTFVAAMTERQAVDPMTDEVTYLADAFTKIEVLEREHYGSLTFGCNDSNGVFAIVANTSPYKSLPINIDSIQTRQLPDRGVKLDVVSDSGKVFMFDLTAKDLEKFDDSKFRVRYMTSNLEFFYEFDIAGLKNTETFKCAKEK